MKDDERLRVNADALTDYLDAKRAGNDKAAEYFLLCYLTYLHRQAEYYAEGARSEKIPEERIQNALATGSAQGFVIARRLRRGGAV